ncbi:hypothetical protein T03_1866 [Trichinella britovi]|uniref:Uncharacterized protein n=1 Tax=Trichinella britovi TaxID=45882 RepID=A0A0V1D427_TRIBR|nr:hypothetical protein T03_1866 [Trichinella britovi]
MNPSKTQQDIAKKSNTLYVRQNKICFLLFKLNVLLKMLRHRIVKLFIFWTILIISIQLLFDILLQPAEERFLFL